MEVAVTVSLNQGFLFFHLSLDLGVQYGECPSQMVVCLSPSDEPVLSPLRLCQMMPGWKKADCPSFCNSFRRWQM